MRAAPLSGLAIGREYFNLARDPVGAMRSLYERHGPIVALGSIAFGEPSRPHVVGAGEEFNRQVFGDTATFRSTGIILRGPKNSAQRRLRSGLTRMTGDEHRQMRKLVQPPFHRSAVKTYRETMVAQTLALLEGWRPGQRFDICDEMGKLTLGIASAVLFSHDPAEALPIAQLLERWIFRSFGPQVWAFPIDIPGTPYRSVLRDAERIEREILALVARRRASREEHADVVSMLLQARDETGRGMTDVELLGQLAVLFLASFETTTSALTWTLFLLAQHPEVMNELMTELDTVLGGNPPDDARMTQLPFLQAVIKESMRVLPPVPYTVRATTTTVSIGPYRVRTGTRIACNIYMTHHLPELYPEPERFHPTRWRLIERSQYEYLPFSAGPRICLGAMFATQLLTVALATMLQRFRVAVVPGIRIDRAVRISMRPRHGLPMVIFPADGKFAASKVTGQIREMVTLP